MNRREFLQGLLAAVGSAVLPRQSGDSGTIEGPKWVQCGEPGPEEIRDVDWSCDDGWWLLTDSGWYRSGPGEDFEWTWIGWSNNEPPVGNADYAQRVEPIKGVLAEVSQCPDEPWVPHEYVCIMHPDTYAWFKERFPWGREDIEGEPIELTWEEAGFNAHS